MEKEEESSITNVLIVVNNFKTNAGHKSLRVRFGENTFGRDRRLKISWDDMVRGKIG
jgi:hypothetical protein